MASVLQCPGPVTQRELHGCTCVYTYISESVHNPIYTISASFQVYLLTQALKILEDAPPWTLAFLPLMAHRLPSRR